MNIIKELWNGNIKPIERSPWKSGDYSRISREISKAEDELTASFTDDEKSKYEKCISMMLDRQTITEEEVFEKGFKLGVRFMIAALCGKET